MYIYILQSIDRIGELVHEVLSARLLSCIKPQVKKNPGGDSHTKQMGMLIVSLRGVNFGFWSRLGCSGQSANILSRQGLVEGFAKKHRITRREREVNFLSNFVCYVFMSLKLIACRICVCKRSLLGVKICLSHAQSGLLWESQKA